MDGQEYSPSPVRFAQVVDTQDGFNVMLEEAGTANASCYNPDGVTCVDGWVESWASPAEHCWSLYRFHWVPLFFLRA